jgi:hypothetical protein
MRFFAVSRYPDAHYPDCPAGAGTLGTGFIRPLECQWCVSKQDARAWRWRFALTFLIVAAGFVLAWVVWKP